ncbi:hypothetical protein ACWEIK_25795 [Streptomyces sp. NPDC004673]
MITPYPPGVPAALPGERLVERAGGALSSPPRRSVVDCHAVHHAAGGHREPVAGSQAVSAMPRLLGDGRQKGTDPAARHGNEGIDGWNGRGGLVMHGAAVLRRV